MTNTAHEARRTQDKKAAGWSEFAAAEPALAEWAERRFGAYPHHVLATLRADGSPRLTGLEADFRGGELWLGMMPGSRKARDLRRDPRFSLYANPGGGSDVVDGDVRIAGRAVEVTDAEVLARYWRAAAHHPARQRRRPGGRPATDS
ncbi:pyridoxamine 5'-phosphate oxidase family protein [Streptomyces olivaceiscleroticus]|uniref:Pyridoxamine 5'-phosphate oxidase N-terminal domain-containing protein n=1 Tax=Streptomyces olivaceiscleroticus TaxID=68245 RepID=A0ABN0ZD01_9ACTN